MRGAKNMREKPRLEWRAHALVDLLNIVAHIADDNPDAAQALKDEIEAKAAKLPDHPKLYKASTRVKGMREMIVTRNYIVLYRETKERIEVLSRAPCTAPVAADEGQQALTPARSR